jgi:addiction module RelE/StbE family toxin
MEQRRPRRFAGDLGLHLRDNPDAAERLISEIETKASKLPERPDIYRKGRVAGTREMVVRPNYLIVYALSEQAVLILRVLHAAQQWPT